MTGLGAVEARLYLEDSGGDVSKALAEWRADNEWEAEQYKDGKVPGNLSAPKEGRHVGGGGHGKGQNAAVVESSMASMADPPPDYETAIAVEMPQLRHEGARSTLHRGKIGDTLTI